ncbi:hypothetical protein [Calidifontibacter terrae]
MSLTRARKVIAFLGAQVVTVAFAVPPAVGSLTRVAVAVLEVVGFEAALPLVAGAAVVVVVPVAAGPALAVLLCPPPPLDPHAASSATEGITSKDLMGNGIEVLLQIVG